MKTLIIFALSAVLAFVGYAHGAPEATCKEFVGMLTKKQLGGISACSKTMKFKNPKEKAAKMNCILKCVLIKEKMLNADGQFVSDEKFEEFLTELVPTNLMPIAGPKLRNCKNSAVTGPFDNSDEFCKTYDPLIKCMLDVIGTLCKTPLPPAE